MAPAHHFLSPSCHLYPLKARCPGVSILATLAGKQIHGEALPQCLCMGATEGPVNTWDPGRPNMWGSFKAMTCDLIYIRLWRLTPNTLTPHLDFRLRVPTGSQRLRMAVRGPGWARGQFRGEARPQGTPRTSQALMALRSTSMSVTPTRQGHLRAEPFLLHTSRRNPGLGTHSMRTQGGPGALPVQGE